MARALLLGLAILLPVSMPLHAQTYPSTWQPSADAFWSVNAGHPGWFAPGISLVVGVHRRTDGSGGQVRGLDLALEPSAGGISASAGIAWFEPNDTGVSGFSLQATYFRSWATSWQVTANHDYVGVVSTYHLSLFAVRAGILRSTSPRVSSRYIPSIHVGLYAQFY